MLIVHVRAMIKPESREAFLAAVREVITRTRREPGALSYSCYEDVLEPNLFIFHEEWRSERDLDDHLAQPYTQALLADAGQWVAAAPVLFQTEGLRGSAYSSSMSVKVRDENGWCER